MVEGLFNSKILELNRNSNFHCLLHSVCTNNSHPGKYVACIEIHTELLQ